MSRDDDALKMIGNVDMEKIKTPDPTANDFSEEAIKDLYKDINKGLIKVSSWEEEFIDDLKLKLENGKKNFSPKQLEILYKIYNRVY